MIGRTLKPELFDRAYDDLFAGDDRWQQLDCAGG